MNDNVFSRNVENVNDFHMENKSEESEKLQDYDWVRKTSKRKKFF